MEQIQHSYYEDTVYYTDETKETLEDFLQDSAARLLGANVTVGIIGGNYDSDFSVDYISRFALDIMGYRYEEFWERTHGKVDAFLYPEDKPVFESRTEHGEDLKGREYRLVDKNGEPIWCKEVRRDYEQDGKAKWLIAIRSIQDMVLAEENSKSFLIEAMEDAKAANAAKNIFLSRMSHDLRTPINGILGMTELAQVDLDDRVRVKECLEKVQISGNYLLMLVNELLDFSKLESSQMAMEEHPFDLLDSIRDCLEMVRAQREQKEQILHTKGFHVTHTKVMGDNLRLQQLITNIVGNCIKYTPRRGTIQIEVQEQETSQPGLGRYCITIQDNGIGMPEDFLQHIFEPFARVEDERTSKVSGTGLGMSIANHIAKKMGGNIQVYSKEGEGSTFVVNLYLKLQNQQNMRDRIMMKPSGSNTTFNYADYRVLLVEDNDINRELAVNVLRLTGVEVDSAVDGKEAVDKFTEAPVGHYDMIFMDIQMPVMDGYEATRTIRSMEREDNDLPIVALTANAFADDVVASMEAGMNEHIAKPLKIKVLHETMGKWLKQKPTK